MFQGNFHSPKQGVGQTWPVAIWWLSGGHRGSQPWAARGQHGWVRRKALRVWGCLSLLHNLAYTCQSGVLLGYRNPQRFLRRSRDDSSHSLGFLFGL